MRKLFFIGILFSYFLSNAQDVKFGVHVDPKFTWQVPESRDVEKVGSTFGFGGGLIIDRYFQDNYAFETGISLGTQGGKLKFDYNFPFNAYDQVDTLPAGTTVDYSLQYITIPLGLKLKSNEIGYFTFFVNLGITNQLNIKAKASTDDDSELKNATVKEEINWFDMGYHFGGGIEYALSKDTAVLLGIFYQNGFLDVTTASPRVNSRVLTIRTGIIF
jgi:opacity protein-like surface antigen